MNINSNDSAYSIVEELKSFGEVLTHKCESLTTSVAILPEFLEYNYDLEYSLPRLSSKELLHFSVLVAATEQPYLILKMKEVIMENLRKKWRFSLFEELDESQLRTIESIELLLDEENLITYQLLLLETNSIFSTTNELFGALTKMIKTVVPRVKLRRNYGSKVVKPQRKRGYNDKGSRRPSHKWVEQHDVSLTILQLKNEEYVETNRHTKHLIQGLLW